MLTKILEQYIIIDTYSTISELGFDVIKQKLSSSFIYHTTWYIHHSIIYDTSFWYFQINLLIGNLHLFTILFRIEFNKTLACNCRVKPIPFREIFGEYYRQFLIDTLTFVLHILCFTHKTIIWIRFALFIRMYNICNTIR